MEREKCTSIAEEEQRDFNNRPNALRIGRKMETDPGFREDGGDLLELREGDAVGWCIFPVSRGKWSVSVGAFVGRDRENSCGLGEGRGAGDGSAPAGFGGRVGDGGVGATNEELLLSRGEIG